MGKEEARAYLALLRLGEATATEVAEEAGIPVSHIYSVLRKLLDRGFITVIGGRPRKYVILSPRESLLRVKEELITRLERGIKALLEETTRYRREGLRVFLERKAMLQILKYDLEKAVYIKAMLGARTFLDRIIETLMTISNRGSRICLILHENMAKELRIQEGRGNIETRYVHVIPPLDILILDANVVYLSPNIGTLEAFIGIRMIGEEVKPYDDYFDHVWVEHYAVFLRRARAWRIEELY